MFCPQCGSDIGDSAVCPYCSPQQSGGAEYQPPMHTPAEASLKTAFSGTLFLVMCILMTISVAFSFIGALTSGSFAIEIIDLLFVIAMWMVYATSKSADNALSPGGLKLADGTSLAVLVIGWVLFGIFIFFALVFMIVRFANIPLDLEDLYYAIYSYSGSVFEGMIPSISIISSILLSLLVVVFVIAAVVIALVNLFFFRNLRRFIHSVRGSAASGVLNIQKAKTVRIWIIVIGVISALNAVSNLFQMSEKGALSALASCAYAAAIIIAFVWIGQNFLSTEQDSSI